MPQVYVKEVTGSRKRSIEVSETPDVRELKAAVAEATGLPLARLKLVLNGKPLEDGCTPSSGPVKVQGGDTIIALVAPKAPPTHATTREGEPDEEDDDDTSFHLPKDASGLQRRLAGLLRDRLKVPDVVLTIFFSVSLRTWMLLVVWLLLAPVAQKYELGPIYIIGTCFALIFINLGRRQAGEESAYSIFNEGFRELPGTLNAERLDRDIRAGRF